MDKGLDTAKKLLFATQFAATKHTNQRRKNAAATPYIEHPIGVAWLLADCGVTDTDVLAAALLHDTIEDTDCTWQELEKNFNPTVVQYVREVTDDKTLPKDQRKRLQPEHAKTASHGAKLVKMADKLHNLQTLLSDPPTWWDWRRIQGYFVWGKTVIDACFPDGPQSGGKHSPASGSGYVPQPWERLWFRLNDLFRSSFTYKGVDYPTIPTDVNLEEVLEEYYADMVEAGKKEDD